MRSIVCQSNPFSFSTLLIKTPISSELEWMLVSLLNWKTILSPSKSPKVVDVLPTSIVNTITSTCPPKDQVFWRAFRFGISPRAGDCSAYKIHLKSFLCNVPCTPGYICKLAPGRLCAEQRNIFLIKMLSQEPNLCSAEKPRRSQSSLCVITTERIYTIGFNAPQNPNLAFAFLCIFFLSHASLPRASLQM